LSVCKPWNLVVLASSVLLSHLPVGWQILGLG